MDAWYDLPECISGNISPLDALCGLTNERRIAATVRGEKLRNFLVLGQFLLDSKGCCSRVEQPHGFSSAHSVQLLSTEAVTRLGKLIPYSFPFSDSRCPICQRRWGMSNLQLAQLTYEFARIPLTEYIDQEFRIVQARFQKSAAGGRYIEHSISREDETLLEVVPSPDYIIDRDDFLACLHALFFCDSCYQVYSKENNRSFYEELLRESSFEYCRVEQLATANEENNPSPCFVAETGNGQSFLFRWQGRVLELDYRNLCIPPGVDLSRYKRKSPCTVELESFTEALEFLEKLVA